MKIERGRMKKGGRRNDMGRRRVCDLNWSFEMGRRIPQGFFTPCPHVKQLNRVG